MELKSEIGPSKEPLLPRLVRLLRSWNEEWEEMIKDRDTKPLNHIHRQIWEGMCNTQMMRIRDLQNLIREETPNNKKHTDDSGN